MCKKRLFCQLIRNHSGLFSKAVSQEVLQRRYSFSLPLIAGLFQKLKTNKIVQVLAKI
jgi:hypothetical protein